MHISTLSLYRQVEKHTRLGAVLSQCYVTICTTLYLFSVQPLTRFFVILHKSS